MPFLPPTFAHEEEKPGLMNSDNGMFWFAKEDQVGAYNFFEDADRDVQLVPNPSHVIASGYRFSICS